MSAFTLAHKFPSFKTSNRSKSGIICSARIIIVFNALIFVIHLGGIKEIMWLTLIMWCCKSCVHSHIWSLQDSSKKDWNSPILGEFSAHRKDQHVELFGIKSHQGFKCQESCCSLWWLHRLQHEVARSRPSSFDCAEWCCKCTVKRWLMAKDFSSLKCKNRLGFNQKTIACKSFSLEVLCHSRDWKWRRFGLDSFRQAFHSSEIFQLFPSLFRFLPCIQHYSDSIHCLAWPQSLLKTNVWLGKCSIKAVLKKFWGYITENCNRSHEKPSGSVPAEYQCCERCTFCVWAVLVEQYKSVWRDETLWKMWSVMSRLGSFYQKGTIILKSCTHGFSLSEKRKK